LVLTKISPEFELDFFYSHIPDGSAPGQDVIPGGKGKGCTVMNCVSIEILGKIIHDISVLRLTQCVQQCTFKSANSRILKPVSREPVDEIPHSRYIVKVPREIPSLYEAYYTSTYTEL
jgi:hypothetical protein